MTFKFKLIRHVTCEVKFEPLKSVQMEFFHDKPRNVETGIFLADSICNINMTWNILNHVTDVYGKP